MFSNNTNRKSKIPADDETRTSFELNAKDVDVAADLVNSAYFKLAGSDTAKKKNHTGFFSGLKNLFSPASTGASQYAPLVDKVQDLENKVEDLENDNQVRPFSSK